MALDLRWVDKTATAENFVYVEQLPDGITRLSAGLDEYEMWGEVYLTNEQATQIALALLGFDKV